MDASKIEKLRSIGKISVTADEIAEQKEKLASGAKVCVTICTWIIQKAAGTGSCVAGEAALSGIFTLAEIVFFPEGEEILVPLEVVVDAAWGATCEEIGIAALGKNAEEYAEQWCAKISS